MAVIFRTNIDGYSKMLPKFPEAFTPVVGDYIEIPEVWHPFLKEKQLPLRLQVKSRTWVENTGKWDTGIDLVVELWFSDIDFAVCQPGVVERCSSL